MVRGFGAPQRPTSSLLEGRLSMDSFPLPRFMKTHDEHTWHGREVRPAHSPRQSQTNQPFQATFSINAYKAGSLKPSVMDQMNDKTVTRFYDPKPSREQLELASEGYKNLALPWERYVSRENAVQHRALNGWYVRTKDHPTARSPVRAATAGSPTRITELTHGNMLPHSNRFDKY
jgi:hypothetical protein